MEPVVRKLRLHDEKFELIRDPQEALDILAALLERGRRFFPENSVEQGSRRICRVVRLGAGGLTKGLVGAGLYRASRAPS